MDTVPDHLPEDLKPSEAADLMDTLTGLCNESDLTRAEILGVIEAVKLRLWWSWQREHEKE